MCGVSVKAVGYAVNLLACSHSAVLVNESFVIYKGCEPAQKLCC